MKYFVVKVEEASGYDCDGHEIPFICAANSREEAIGLFTWDPYWQVEPNAEELKLPDLSRRRKPFVVKM